MKLKLNLPDVVREAVFGANDGIVSTFGLISGLAGALVDNKLIVLVGLVQVFAAGMSMGLGAYISTKSQNEVVSSEYDRVIREIDVHPAREKAHLRAVLKSTGLKKDELSVVTDAVTSSKSVWANFLLEQRFGVASESLPQPVISGLVMFLSFFVSGLLVIVPFFFLNGRLGLFFSSIISLSLLFFVGAFKTRFTNKDPYISGFENLLVGLFTAVVGFAVGSLFSAF